jgi:sugar lactone lactonase YvrE
MRWLWRDWRSPIAAPTTAGERQWSQLIVEPGAGWELVSQGHKFTEGPAVDKSGALYFTDIPNNQVWRVDGAGKPTLFREDSGGANGLMFGPDGRLYACQNSRRRIVAWSMDGNESVLAEDVNSNDLAVTAKGAIYFTDPRNRRVWFIDPQGAKRIVHEGIGFPNGVVLSPDQALAYVCDYWGRFVWSFQVQADGSLDYGQPFGKLEIPDETDRSLADGMTVDTEGHLYVTTAWGVQVLDQPGRVVAILNKPQNSALANCVFAGADLKFLYVTAGDKVFRRRMRRQGVNSWAPVKPPVPRL